MTDELAAEIVAEQERGLDMYEMDAMCLPFLTMKERMRVLFGEVVEVVEAVTAGDIDGPHGLRAELLQVAALATSWIEVIDGAKQD